MTTSYQGWTNYETWNVALWIGNDEGSYNYWEKEQAGECYRNALQGGEAGDREAAIGIAAHDLKNRLKSELDDNAELPKALDGTLYADLLSAALSEVNWYEIARNYIEGLDLDAMEEEEGVFQGEE